MITDNTTVHPRPRLHHRPQRHLQLQQRPLNLFWQPTAFADPHPTTFESPCPTFYYYKDKTKTPMVHAAMPVPAVGGTSMPVFCVEGYVHARAQHRRAWW